MPILVGRLERWIESPKAARIQSNRTICEQDGKSVVLVFATFDGLLAASELGDRQKVGPWNKGDKWFGHNGRRSCSRSRSLVVPISQSHWTALGLSVYVRSTMLRLCMHPHTHTHLSHLHIRPRGAGKWFNVWMRMGGRPVGVIWVA